MVCIMVVIEGLTATTVISVLNVTIFTCATNPKKSHHVQIICIFGQTANAKLIEVFIVWNKFNISRSTVEQC